ncbi:MAG: DUF501 domain-containing protein [Actinomycetota bacterium]|nr:DUF501 domain-containing protein [Actinomycetota bacterium]
MDDTAVVSWQLGRPARPFRRVAVRCRHGFPAVTEQDAFTPDGRPFPTTYYLTCPWLVAAVSRLEAEGGVARWARNAADDPELGASLARADAEQRQLRPEFDGGIGGTRERSGLKCLHAHAAFALASPRYELGERVVAEAGERWCPDARCSRALPEADTC